MGYRMNKPKSARGKLERKFPKCRCGATLSLLNQQNGTKQCRRCEQQIEDSNDQPKTNL